MVHDYLAHGLAQTPLEFARQYYKHYPFFGVGYWPPLFYVLMGLWFMVVGVGRLQALLLVAAIASGCAWLVSVLVRRRTGDTAAFCAGLIFLTLPDVQLWFCAVMLDQTVVFFSLASAVFVIRYFERPNWPNATGISVCAALTVLTKYSGLYVCALPVCTLLLLRRFDLLRLRSFWVQPVLLSALVAPWILWTAHLASIGLPSERHGAFVARSLTFVRESFQMFPPILLVLVILGLLVLVVHRSVWRADMAVMALCVVLLIGSLIASTQGAEHRYLQPVAAALLVLSFAGWWTFVSAATPRGAVWVKAVPALVLLVTAAICCLQVLRFRRVPNYPIRSVVRAITGEPAWTGKQILVAPDMEGAVIAEFVAQDPHRPSYWLRRPSKSFASMDWFGGHYTRRFPSARELMDELRANPVDLLIWHAIPAESLRPHERQMQETLVASPAFWRPLASFGSWSIYQCMPDR
jgi:4-amino-4-deoxy-L-arabinose transferase-like glycosyltransferase